MAEGIEFFFFGQVWEEDDEVVDGVFGWKKIKRDGIGDL